MARDASYLDIAAALTKQLASAPAGSRVASEHALMAAHGVSRPTARAALQELEQRFVVRRVRGAGTFVNRRVDYVIGPHVPPSATSTLARAGVTGNSRVLRAGAASPSADTTRRLALGRRGRVVELVRETSIDGAIAAHSTTRLPARLVPGIVEHLTDGMSLFALLRERYALRPVRAWSRASLDLPPDDVAACLGLDAVVPSWLVESVNRNGRRGEPIELTTTWMRADVVRVVFELEDG